MVRFQTRDHIIMWLERYCPRKAITRAISEGHVELLGGFSSIPPSGRHGWILRVTSRHKRVWLVAIKPNKTETDYTIGILKEVPWRHWCGDLCENKLYKGDKPCIYRAIKDKINENMVDLQN